MEKITYAQYLQENIGVISMDECLDVISKAEQGKLSDLEIEELLTPVVGTVLSELFNSDHEKFNFLLQLIKYTAEKIQQQQRTIEGGLNSFGNATNNLFMFKKGGKA